VMLSGSDMPSTITRAYGEGIFGTSLRFDSSDETSLGFYDADNAPSDGYFVAAVVEFGDLSLDNGEVQSIFSKADGGGFALELTGGLFSTTLRFGVRVGSDYHYATKSMSGVDGSHSHIIYGSYDGSDRVRMWFDNSDSGVSSSSVLSGGVTLNDSPVTVGADPEGTLSTRFHFEGRIQMAMLQRWRDH
jgi:hypothetical protein